MTYIDMLNEFYDFCECNTVSGSAQLLYYTLLGINNRCAWNEWFSRTNVSLSGRMGVSEKVLIRARNELKTLGLIDFVTSKKRGTCTKYSILYSTKSSTKEVQKQYKSSTKEVQKEDINRYKTKTKKEKDISNDISKKSFVPPTIDEVREYCQSRNNFVDPERFVDFYSAKGWMVGKNKMKDWKSAVRTWERNDGRKASTGQSGNIRPEEPENSQWEDRAAEIELHNLPEPYGSKIFKEICAMYPNLPDSEIDAMYDRWCVIYNTKNLGDAGTWDMWKKEYMEIENV